MATQQRGKKTREDVLNTAMHLFSLHGYHHTSTNDILEAAAISKGAFYYHFKSKDDLVLKILDRLQDDIQENVIDPIKEATRPESIFESLANPVKSLSQNDMARHRLLLTRFTLEMSNDDGELARRINQTTVWLTQKITAVIQHAYDQGALSTDVTAQNTADIIVVLWHGGACQGLAKQQALLKTLELLITSRISTVSPIHPITRPHR